MKSNNIDNLIEQALKSDEVPPAALVSHIKSMPIRNAPRIRRRLFTALVAAVLCLMFVLGAAVVTNLFGLRDLLLPDTDPIVVKLPTGEVEEIPQQLISLQGVAGTPEHAAAVAWQKFLNEYDLDATLNNVSNITPLDVPSEYLIYGAYSMEMVEKIREITTRYNLDLLGELTETFPQAHDLESVNQWLFLNPGYHFSSGTFNVQAMSYNVPFSLRASRKGVFDYVFLNIGDYAGYSEWIYENEHGNQLLLVQGEHKSLIFFNAEEVFFAVNILTGTQGDNLGLHARSLSRMELEAFANSLDFQRLWADSRIVFEPVPAAQTPPITPTVPIDGADAIMAQMEGNWTWYFANPTNAAHMNLSADGTWESPGPLPTDHTMGGSFVIVGVEDGIYQIRFTIEHATDPYADFSETFDHLYDAQNDRLGMTLHSGEGEEIVWFWRD